MRYRTFLNAAALTACMFAALSSSGSAAVIISEFMYEADGSDTGREWVEIYNTGDTTVDISGWGIHDEDAGSEPAPAIPAGTMLAPKQALVLIEDQTTFETEWGTGINFLVYPSMGAPGGVGPQLNMANTATAVGDEVIQLDDAAGNLIDAVDYMNSAPFPSVTNDTATSIYVLPGFLDPVLNDLGTSWGRATAGVHGAYQNLVAGRLEAASPGVVVPEPASLLLVSIAMLGLLARRRRPS